MNLLQYQPWCWIARGPRLQAVQIANASAGRFQAATGQLEGIIDADPTAKAESICVSFDGKFIVSSHDKGVMKMWRIGRGGVGAIISRVNP